jgi:23S rRNA pseudouridine1911/1915/1917 synthase
MNPYPVTAEHSEKTLAAVLRTLLPGQSWSEVRRLIESRRAKINGELCFDAARRVHEGEVVEVLPRPAPKPRQPEQVAIRHLDGHIVVVEKPSGINTVRHPAERDWTERRRALSPTLEDIVPRLIRQQEGRSPKASLPRLRIVQRLDKETSGLVVFARTAAAERGLGKQFYAHTVDRRYLAIVPGYVKAQTIRSRLVRDRGDGRRGSTSLPNQGKQAITHIEPIERLHGYTLVACRLETGRTHQIRIHLTELGHPVCGEKVYGSRSDQSGAPRLALHAAELGFVHPATGEHLRWAMPLPADLETFVKRLRKDQGR